MQTWVIAALAQLTTLSKPYPDLKRIHVIKIEELFQLYMLKQTRIITGSYVTTTRKPQFSEEDPWSRVESSKFRPMFAGVKREFPSICFGLFVALFVQ